MVKVAFNFEHSRQWLREEAGKLNAAGFCANWTWNDRYLRSTSVEAVGGGLMGSFRQFENGLVDFEVADETGRFLVDRAMMPVNDGDLCSAFEEFRQALLAGAKH